MLHLFNAFLGYSALSGISAVVFFFLVEAPFGELERLLFSRLPPPKAKGKGMELGQEKEEEEGEEERINEATVVISQEVSEEVGEK